MIKLRGSNPSHVSAIAFVFAGWMAISASTVGAQAQPGTGPMKEDKPGLLARAKISPDSARHLARARVANATIAEEGIEVEKGKLVYSFDMRTSGRRGIDEVVVDALTGAIISVAHEGPAQEAAERAHDARERRAKADSVRTP